MSPPFFHAPLLVEHRASTNPFTPPLFAAHLAPRALREVQVAVPHFCGVLTE